MVFLPDLTRSAIEGQVILSDRPCPRCGYNLVGLRTGGRCPECGTPIRHSKRRDGVMADAPIAYLRAQARAAWFVLAGAGGVLAAAFACVLLPAIGSGIVPAVGAGIAATFVLAWGVQRITCPRWAPPTAGVNAAKEWRAARWSARVAIWAWIPAFLFIAWSGATPVSPGSRVISFPAACTLPIGFFGLLVVPTYEALLADWATDTDLGARLKVGMVFLLVTPIFLALARVFTPYALAGLAPFILTAVSWSLTGLCAGYYLFCIAQFAALCTWAVVNASGTLDRDARLSRKIVERIERASAKPATQAESVPPAPADAHPSGARGHFLPRAGNPDAYQVAQEPPKPPGE